MSTDCPTSSLRIFVLANGCPTESSPLNGIFAFDQAKALADLGHSVTLLAIDLRSVRHKRKWGLERWSKDGVTILRYSVPLGRVPLSLEKNVGILCAKKLFRLACKEGEACGQSGKPDIIHAHFALQGIYAREIITMPEYSDCPVVYTEHCSLVPSGDASYCQLMQQACEKADAVLAVSESLAHHMTSWIAKKPQVVYNVVDFELFSQASAGNPAATANSTDTPAKTENPADAVHFVSVGNLIPRKNHLLLVEAFAKAARATQRPLKLTIVGEGSERTALTAAIASYGLEDKVVLTGLLPRADIAEVFSRSDCFVLASSFETFGVVCIEAMAAGLPVIATRCNGPENYVEPFCGTIVEPNNIDEMAEALRAMAENVNSYSSERIREYARNSFSGEAIAQQLTACYLRCLGDE